DYNSDGVARVGSIAYGSSVVRCERDVVEPDVDFIDDVAYKRIYLLQCSDFSFEVSVMACNVGGFYVDENEVLVLASFDDCFGLCFVICLDSTGCAPDIHDFHARDLRYP